MAKDILQKCTKCNHTCIESEKLKVKEDSKYEAYDLVCPKCKNDEFELIGETSVIPYCPACQKSDSDKLSWNDESVYSCEFCGEEYMAINNNGEYQFDAYLGH